MAFDVCDKVRVARQSCCYGHNRNTVCQVLKKEEEKGRMMYLCYPTECELPMVALWHCESCLTKVTE